MRSPSSSQSMHHRGTLFPGKEFQLREAAKIVAEGIVTRILEQETRRSAPLEPRCPLASDL
jgi:hypothetical protein